MKVESIVLCLTLCTSVTAFTPWRPREFHPENPFRLPGLPRFGCGPVCAVYCPYGKVLDFRGCPTCTCKGPDTFSPLNPGRCGPTCMIACQHGRVIDSRGCPTCRCRSRPSCDGVPICNVRCPLGLYARDEQGCQTCRCTIRGITQY